MTTYYVDPGLSTGSNNGDPDNASGTYANAWRSLQEAIDSTNNAGKPAAGDVVLCKAQDGSTADETLTAPIDVDGTQGTSAAGVIVWRGVNASWTDDGTRYVIDADTTAAYCLDYGAIDWLLWENFMFKNATGHGVNMNTSGSASTVYVNCRFTNNGGDGLYARYNTGIIFKCCFDNNTSDGCYMYSSTGVIFSCFRDNGADGLSGQYSNKYIIGCVAYNNVSEGMYIGSYGLFMNNVVDGGTSSTGNGLGVYQDGMMVVGNRITNFDTSGKYGFDVGDETTYLFYNYLHGNDGDLNNADNVYSYSPLGTDSNQYDTGTDDGYTSTGSDYNLKTSAEMRNIAITVPTT